MSSENLNVSEMMRSIEDNRLFFSRRIVDQMRLEIGLQHFWELYRLALALNIMGRSSENPLPGDRLEDKQEIRIGLLDRSEDDYLFFRLFCRLSGRRLGIEEYKEKLKTSVDRGLSYLYYQVGIGREEFAEKDYRLLQKVLGEVRQTTGEHHQTPQQASAEAITFTLGHLNDQVKEVTLNDRSLVPALNIAITGASGSGKTFFAVNLLSKILGASNETRCIILDPKGDIAEKYGNVLKAQNFTFYRLSLGQERQTRDVRSSLPINPFMFGQEKVAITERLLAVFSEAIFQNNPVQQGKFRRAISALLDTKPAASLTVEDLLQEYSAQQDGRDDKVSNFLQSLVNNRVFSGESDPPDKFYSKNVVVSYAPDLSADIQGLVTNLLVTLFRDAHQNFTEGSIENSYRSINRLLFIDEAHNLSNMKSSGLKRLLREGRSFGLGLVLASQHINHFGTLIKGTDLREEIPIWFVLKQTLNPKTLTMLEGMFALSSNQDKRNLESLVGKLQDAQDKEYLAITNLDDLHLQSVPLRLSK